MRKYRILTIVLFIILTVAVIGCDKDKNQKLNFLSDAESAINDGNYEKAIACLDYAISESSSNGDIRDLKDSIQCYLDAKKFYENKDYENALDKLDSISVDSSKYEKFNDDIQELKNSITEKKSQIENNDSLLNEINTLINSGDFINAEKKLSQIAKDNLTNDQITKFNSFNDQIQNYKKTQEEEAAKIENEKNAPNLNLKYRVNESDEEINNTYLQNGEGPIKFACTKPISEVGIGTYRKVENFRPFTTVNFVLENTGKQAVVNPKIEIAFDKMSIVKPSDQSWTPQNHLHGVGTYAGVKWSGENVQNGSPVNCSLNFCNAYILDGATMTITISGDNVTAKSYTVSVTHRE